MAINRATAVVGIFLGLHVIPVWWHSVPVWGVDFLVYYPGWVAALCVLLSALILMPSVRERMILGISAVPDAVDPWGSRRSFVLFALIVIAAGGGAFIGLRSAAHLLGDGYLRLRELPDAAFGTALKTSNAPLALWAIKTLYGAGLTGTSSELTYRVYSVLSGMVYLLAALFAARVLGRDGRERTVLLGFAITPGFVALFFGYVETYALLMPAIMIYLVTGIQTLRGRLPLWVPAGILGAFIPLHLTLVTFAPSLLALGVLRAKSEIGSHREPDRWKLTLKAVAQAGAAPAVLLFVLGAIGFDAVGYMGKVKGSHLLPFFSQPVFIYHYGVFSPAHLIDVVNHYLLVAPGAVMVCFLAAKRAWAGGTEAGFLAAASIFPFLFTAFANPEIGAFRDWDAFAYPALPLTLWAGVALVRHATSRLAHVGLMVCGAAALHSLLWVGVNARYAPAEARFAAVLSHAQVSRQARSYGWETLGTYHQTRNRPEAAFNAYRRALEANPENPRHWLFVGNHYFQSGRLADAESAYRRACELRSDLPQVHVNLGAVYQRMGRGEDAIREFEKAIALDAGFAEAHANLGVAYAHLGRHEEAIHHLEMAVAIRPDYAEAFFNLGLAYRRAGAIEKAAACFREVLRLNPGHARADVMRRWLEVNP